MPTYKAPVADTMFPDGRFQNRKIIETCLSLPKRRFDLIEAVLNEGNQSLQKRCCNLLTLPQATRKDVAAIQTAR